MLFINLLTIPVVLSIISRDDIPIDTVTILEDYEEWQTLQAEYVKFAKDYPFGWPSLSCKSPPSFPPPSDIHSLAPWHITVIGAIGDSLTAARAAKSTDLSNIQEEYRGISFAIGGDEPISKRATLANIFAHYSNSLTGPSIGTSTEKNEKLSQFNVAKSGSFAGDLPRQAAELVRRIKSHKNVNIDKSWKFMNLFTGSNDLCKYCKNQTLHSPSNFGHNLREAVRILKSSLPRTFVNLMPSFHVDVLLETHEHSKFCVDFHKISCPCLFEMDKEAYLKLKRGYDDELEQFSAPEYQTEEFAVVVSPAMNITQLPKLGNTPNVAFIALDCFHFSEIAHDLTAKLVWKNLFEPYDKKSILTDFSEVRPQLWDCPPMACPYLKTARNSYNCSRETHPWPQFHIKALSLNFEASKRSIPSRSELEMRAALEEDGTIIVFILFGVVFLVIGIAIVLVILSQRSKKFRKRKATDSTPLLLTANLYDDVF